MQMDNLPKMPGTGGALDGAPYGTRAAIGFGGLLTLVGLGYLAYKMLKKR